MTSGKVLESHYWNFSNLHISSGISSMGSVGKIHSKHQKINCISLESPTVWGFSIDEDAGIKGDTERIMLATYLDCIT